MRLLLVLGFIALALGVALLWLGMMYAMDLYPLPFGLDLYIFIFVGIFLSIGIAFVIMGLKSSTRQEQVP